MGVIDRRTLLGASSLFLLPRGAFGRPDFAPAKPKIVLIERNPWLMVIGSDSPTFVLYDDGRVIYATKAGYVTVALSPAERDALLTNIDAPALQPLAKHYDRYPGVSDMRTAVLVVFEDAKPSIISVYGGIDSSWTKGSIVPEKVVIAGNRLRSFTHPDAQPWLPEQIEVMIWPYEYAPQKSIVWPARWPGLDSPDTVKRREGAYSLFIPSADLSRLRAFLKTRREKGAVEISGRKWAVDWRLLFPTERAWMDPARGIGADNE